MATKEPLFNRLRNHGVKDVLKRNLIAEFTGTFFLVFIGTCIVAQFHLTHAQTTNWLGVTSGWGFTIMLCVAATSRTSGGFSVDVDDGSYSIHMGPPLFAGSTPGCLPCCWLYVFLLHRLVISHLFPIEIDLFNAYDKGIRALMGPTGSGVCFCSYPNPALQGYLMPYIDQIVCTGLLCYFLCVVVDERNQIPKALHPLYFFVLLTMIGAGFGVNMGYPMNPARDLGPRLFSVFVYGGAPFSTPYASYFLAPIIGPCIGAVFGGWLYQVSLGMHVPPVAIEEDKEAPEELKLLKA